MTDREDYLRDVIGPFVERLRVSFDLTENPDVQAKMTAAINAYDAEMAALAAPTAGDARPG